MWRLRVGDWVRLNRAHVQRRLSHRLPRIDRPKAVITLNRGVSAIRLRLKSPKYQAWMDEPEPEYGRGLAIEVGETASGAETGLRAPHANWTTHNSDLQRGQSPLSS